jgi:tripartite-type tricarboxylate transporter receptor subunit TctC
MKTKQVFAAALCILGLAGTAHAETPYPNRPIRIVVPYPAGGYFDLLGRSMGARLSTLLKQSVVIENRPGANGIIGAKAVAGADADGYTLLMGGIGPNATNVALYKNLSYDPTKDFVPLVHILNAPCILVVNPKAMPVKTVSELLELVRKKPGEVPFASAGIGSSQHLFGELFEYATHTRMMHVPFQGSNPSIAALLSGEVPVSFGIAGDVIEHVKSGRLVALATTGAKRIPELPNVPTMKEAGVDFVANGWFGLYAPTGTPQPVLDVLRKQSQIALQDPDTRKRISADGAAEVIDGDYKALQALQDSEIPRWTKIAKEAGISAQ